ncbi:methyltransferase domain-containing protein [Streptomyces sp. NPDC018045]|uniref:methyltransferase domain-containing protein n=1 Tax=Streptomyces sp. NPDC018045 TaxID=3365037 RepID=UPI00379BAEBB
MSASGTAPAAPPAPTPAPRGDLAAWARLGKVLRALDWPLRAETYRQAAGSIHHPWLTDQVGNDPLFRLLHLGRSHTAPPPELSDALAALHLMAPPDGSADGAPLPDVDGDAAPYRTAHHYFTAFRGLLTVGDHHARPPRSGVYLGEDGLMFTDRVLSTHAEGTALEIGCGSGLTAAALAGRGLRTTAIDISADCVAATIATAALNGVADRVEAEHADAGRALAGAARYDFVAANPPGLPVPDTVAYGPAGNGGPDGLAVVRTVWENAPRILRDGGALVMRFECAGDLGGPRALPEIFALAGDSSVWVTVHARLPMRTRSALTALRATPHNPGDSPEELLRRLDAHTDALGASRLYTCFMVLRKDGRARREVHDLTTADRPPGGAAGAPTPPPADADRLPPGLAGLDWRPQLALLHERWDDAVRAAARHHDADAVLAEVFPDALERDPINSRSLHAFLSALPGMP